MSKWLDKKTLRTVIFGTSTKAGKNFDVILLFVILMSVLVVMLETVPSYDAKFHVFFITAEILFTIFFTAEYIIRIYSAKDRWKYITSFFGIIDLLSILPAYIGLFAQGAMSLVTIRTLRLLRVFRIFKMMGFMKEGRIILQSMKASLTRISVFLFFVLIMVCIFGSLMYIIEGNVPNTKFDSIPRSIYWAVVTLTTVGYGDISPTTNFGQFISAIVMILGYSVIAVPTGIISADLVNNKKAEKVEEQEVCPSCSLNGHHVDAVFCKYCGTELLNA